MVFMRVLRSTHLFITQSFSLKTNGRLLAGLIFSYDLDQYSLVVTEREMRLKSVLLLKRREEPLT